MENYNAQQKKSTMMKNLTINIEINSLHRQKMIFNFAKTLCNL